jgi:hypothetical protein
MRDPHVVSLRYRLELGKNVEFDNPQPVEGETDAFRFRLENGVLTVQMNDHFASPDCARQVVDGFLRSWETDAGLSYGSPMIHFNFEDAEMVDRDPPSPGSPQAIQLRTLSTIIVAETTAVRVPATEYPEPPRHLRAGPDVETLWQRYQGYLDGREPLPSMAYFCLTVVEAYARGRRRAAREYRIHPDILRRLGEFTSTRGDAGTARKAADNSTYRPLTQPETAWVEAAVRAIIRRVGECGAIDSLPQINMSDLPRL